MAKRIDSLEGLLKENEKKMDTLDKATIQMSRRYEVSVEEAHRKMAQVIGAGNGPVIVSKKGRKETNFAVGNRPGLPPFPGFLELLYDCTDRTPLLLLEQIIPHIFFNSLACCS